MIRFACTCFIVTVIYMVGTIIINNMTNQKMQEVEELIQDTNQQIAKIEADTQTINNKKAEYDTLIRNLETINEEIASENSRKNAIPNLLSRIMYNISRNVQLTSIQNTADKHIVINAQAEDYDQLGYFLAAIKNEGILVNVKSNSGIKQNQVVSLTIEGDMP